MTGYTSAEEAWVKALRAAARELEWAAPEGAWAIIRSGRVPLLRLVTRRVELHGPACDPEYVPSRLRVPVDVRHPDGEYVGRVRFTLESTRPSGRLTAAEYRCEEE